MEPRFMGPYCRSENDVKGNENFNEKEYLYYVRI